MEQADDEHEVNKEIALAHWDGMYPPPAAIRCHESRREQLGPNVSTVSVCMLLDGHDGACDFG